MQHGGCLVIDIDTLFPDGSGEVRMPEYAKVKAALAQGTSPNVTAPPPYLKPWMFVQGVI